MEAELWNQLPFPPRNGTSCCRSCASSIPRRPPKNAARPGEMSCSLYGYESSSTAANWRRSGRTVLNVAARGAGLRLKQRLRKGDKLLLPLTFREGGGWLVLCEVCNCTPLDRGFFKIGVQVQRKNR